MPGNSIRDGGVERCDHEMAEAERLLRAGHPDIEGLVMALHDWATEKRLLLEMERDV